ncbi:nucleotidyltransferase family protein [Loktanella sp. F6476L]|uniref:nucleotidyltransferase family protein n=1 Tax=Loktanella sp. F6476L TaxID=2926405 RepID=UPI001FF3DDA2|nr:nucleotidyltransferase family protein [Loktanella sp. F6476L]MCK0120748.1 nucleotidyltransferase family protein [Loktanella sp. F6476L]
MTSIMLFAAGLGTRMGPLTADKPKPMVEVAGRPLIDYALDLTKSQPLTPPVVNLHYKADILRGHLDDRSVVFSDETDLLRDTGGGLRHALPLLGPDPVVTLNTDAIWNGPNPIAQLLNAWRDDMEGLLMLIPTAQVLGHKGKGDFVIDNTGRLTRQPGHIYSGLQMIRTDGLAEISDDVFSLNRLWDNAIARGTLHGITYAGRWCDVGQPDSIPIAETLIGKNADV